MSPKDFKVTTTPPLMLVLFFASPTLSLAQQSSTEAVTDRAALQAFTAEIHQLRIAIEQTVSVLPRMQLAVTRFQMQQSRVDKLNEELQTFRAQLESTVTSKERMEKTLNEMGNQAASLDPAQRTGFEERRRFFKLQVEEQTAGVQEMRSKEVELSNQLQKERAVLCELTEQLNGIEKMLQRVQ